MKKNKYSLSHKQMENEARRFNIMPLYREVIADMETPVSAYLKISRDDSYACLLESVEGGERWGRYSFIVYSPASVMSVKNNEVVIKKNGAKTERAKSKNPFQELRKMLIDARPMKTSALPSFWGGIVGYVSYDMVRNIEKLTDRKPPKDADLPDMTFIEAHNIVIFDHLKHSMKIVKCIDLRGKKWTRELYDSACKEIDTLIEKLQLPLKRRANRASCGVLKVKNVMTKNSFKKIVSTAKRYIDKGDIIQVVLSQRFDVKTKTEPFDIYRALRIINPSPYMYFFKLDELHIIGSSPEILVKKEGLTAITRPIAGTRRRGKNDEDDALLIAELKSDPKERAEHIMLVDLGRNDLSRVCEHGSVKTSELFSIEKYSHVIHMVSSVTGSLRKNKDALDLFVACFPAGTVSGAPKIRAMEIIDELEPISRGLYAGAVGYFSYDGDMDMAITIRTIIFRDGTAHIQSGAGVVADSSPEKEYKETLNKAGALFGAIRLSEQINDFSH